MNKPLTLLFAAILIGLVAGAPALGAVLYSNVYDPASMSAWSSWYEIPNAGGTLHHQSFTDFYVESGVTVTDFHWWGVPTGLVEGFDFEIWTNDGPDDRPGTMVYSEFVAGDAGESFVETNASYGSDVFSYGIDLSTPFETTSPDNYWFSVVAHSPGSWYWAQGAHQDFDADWQHFSINEAPEDGWVNPADLYGVDFAFEVTGTPVPEPATLGLLGLGLAGAAVRNRRRAGCRRA